MIIKDYFPESFLFWEIQGFGDCHVGINNANSSNQFFKVSLNSLFHQHLYTLNSKEHQHLKLCYKIETIKTFCFDSVEFLIVVVTSISTIIVFINKSPYFILRIGSEYQGVMLQGPMPTLVFVELLWRHNYYVKHQNLH